MPGKYTKLTDVQGVIDLHNAGHDTAEISHMKGMNRRTVQRILKKFKDSGSGELPLHKKSPGRPRKISKRTQNVLKRAIEIDPCLTANDLMERYPRLLAGVSKRCIQETLQRDLKYRSCRARKKPLINEKQVKNRLKFVDQCKGMTQEDWRKVMWTDESNFCVGTRAPFRVRRRKGSDPCDPKYTQKTFKNPDHIMVWGAFSYYGLGDLVFLPPKTTMNQWGYLELLYDHGQESMDKCQATMFQQDGAPCHRAKTVMNHFENCGISILKNWPGNSPDISPIENLWALMKAELRKKNITSIPQLKEELNHLWNNMNVEWCQKLADSLPKRLAEVKRKKGHAIKY